MACSQNPKPTIVAAANFDAEKDSKALRSAMKGLGTDEKAIIKIVCARDVKQLKELQKVYQQLFGRVLVDDLKSELGGKLRDVIMNLFLDDTEFCVKHIQDAIKGVGTDDSVLIEIICSRTGEELAKIKEMYKKQFNKELEKEIAGDTSGDYKRFLISLLSADRETSDVDEQQAVREQEELYKAGQKEMGTDEEVFNMIFARRSWAQLKRTFEIYEKVHKKNIDKVLFDEFGGNILFCLQAVARIAQEDREAYFAEQLHAAMRGLGTNDQKLIRLVTNRSNLDLNTVKVHFLKKYGKTLEDWVKDDCSGDYLDALMTIIKGNH